MKKKRFIMHDTALTTYTAPAVLVEEYDRQIKEFGFKDKQEILIYLAVGLYNERNGIKSAHAMCLLLPPHVRDNEASGNPYPGLGTGEPPPPE